VSWQFAYRLYDRELTKAADHELAQQMEFAEYACKQSVMHLDAAKSVFGCVEEAALKVEQGVVEAQAEADLKKNIISEYLGCALQSNSKSNPLASVEHPILAPMKPVKTTDRSPEADPMQNTCSFYNHIVLQRMCSADIAAHATSGLKASTLPQYSNLSDSMIPS
jgi:hypothetical protein